MCGLLGCFQQKPGRAQPPVAVETLLGRIRHRGPDDMGIHHNRRGVLAHTRLSIIDVAHGHQPMSNEDERLWIAYNGETYNFRELRQKLPSHHRLKTQSDTEVILHLFEEEGPDCVKRFDGMFAFALLNGDELFLARDPLGVKPLYYAEREGWLYFASEIKALLPMEAPIREFPPGHWFHSREGFRSYFQLEDWTAGDGMAVDSLEALQQTLRKAVEKRLVSDVPVGVFLSGGLDSSLVAALMRERVEDLHTFSVGTADSLDLRYARQVAEFLQTHHHERVFTESEMRVVLPNVIYHLESFDFALVRSAIANYFVARLASGYVKVVLVGEGSDEIFAGYHYLKDLSQTEQERELLRITSALHHSNLQRVDRMTMAHGVEGREPYLDLDLLKLAFRLPLEFKQRDGVEKWAVRTAFQGQLPPEVLWRAKEKFSRGAGSALVFEVIANREISDREFERERLLSNGTTVRSKEELYYYRIFRKFFPESVASCLGWTAAPERR
jgi:asparagine synthase (glutamine-hydrolysing)